MKIISFKSYNEKKNPCWKGYKQIGIKREKSKKVANCVPNLNDNDKVLKFNEFNLIEKKDNRLIKAGVKGYNKPKRTPNHSTKSHIVVAKDGNKIKTIRFGEQGANTAGKPKPNESERMKKKRKSFKARHAKNIAKGKMSAAYWADKVKW